MNEIYFFIVMKKYDLLNELCIISEVANMKRLPNCKIKQKYRRAKKKKVLNLINAVLTIPMIASIFHTIHKNFND